MNEIRGVGCVIYLPQGRRPQNRLWLLSEEAYPKEETFRYQGQLSFPSETKKNGESDEEAIRRCLIEEVVPDLDHSFKPQELNVVTLPQIRPDLRVTVVNYLLKARSPNFSLGSGQDIASAQWFRQEPIITAKNFRFSKATKDQVPSLVGTDSQTGHQMRLNEEVGLAINRYLTYKADDTEENFGSLIFRPWVRFTLADALRFLSRPSAYRPSIYTDVANRKIRDADFFPHGIYRYLHSPEERVIDSL